jgi:hypothetical protein
MTEESPRFAGEGRRGGAQGAPAPLKLNLGEDGFAFQLGADPVRRAAYRDLATIAVAEQTCLLAIGRGPGSESLLLERFGVHLGGLVRELRDRRLRQVLADRFVTIRMDGPIELVEYAPGTAEPGGVAQFVIHPWGLVLAPLDERRPWIGVRRAEIGMVTARPEVGGVRIDAAAGGTIVDLLRLGPAASRHEQDLVALRDAAHRDATVLVEALIPDAPFGVRDLASRVLVDGRPAGPEVLGDAWARVEAAVLSEPVFAESYRELLARAGGGVAMRWLALAPVEPGSAERKAWFFVALPGNLVAMELVSEGAHATYLFRVVPRVQYDGSAPGAMRPAAEAAIAGISDALVDARFLREPIGLPDDQLAGPAFLRYRLALAAIPSLAAARRMFVARLVHRDASSWGQALDELVRWHARSRVDGEAWPGRSGEEAAINEAGANAGGTEG